MYDPNYQATGFGVATWLFFIGLYVFVSFSLYKIAQKTGPREDAWWSFIPILNTVLMIKMAGRPLYWFLFLLIPFVNLIAIVVLWVDIARACRQSPLWGVLAVIPIINLFAIAMLAFTKPPAPRHFSSSAPPRQPTKVG